ncbi:MAG TPA: phosphoribosylglycinamide formyltransferase [Candidatus Omnitrophica bacterium]|nr:phosphoribosylglycinamide formyltransferase [Candidatus Omnitrophota bacterium]
MMNKLSVAILGSTRGTDMEGVVNAIRRGELDAEIVLVISDREDAYILKRAKDYGIPAIFINPKEFQKREDFDEKIAEKLEENGVDLILLIGYMMILSAPFVRKYKNRIMNIHPSLLPAFAGGMDLDVHKVVLEHGIKITGCTLHFVDEGTDTGPIILQEAVKVEEEDTPESLKKRVQEAEQKVIVEGIRLFQKGQIKVEGGRVRIFK